MPYLETPLKLEQVAIGANRCVTIGQKKVGLFHTKDGLFAIDNVCPHRDAPLTDGWVKDGHVSCPWHQWQFRLTDGVCLNIPGPRVASYGVEVRDGIIWINLDGKGAKKS